MAKLVRAVHITDPETHRTVVLQPGEEPAPHLAALIRSPKAWEGGVLPDTAEDNNAGDDGDNKPAANKAATRPARGRKAADEGSSGQ